jgi:hypothetical protein
MVVDLQTNECEAMALSTVVVYASLSLDCLPSIVLTLDILLVSQSLSTSATIASFFFHILILSRTSTILTYWSLKLKFRDRYLGIVAYEVA